MSKFLFMGEFETPGPELGELDRATFFPRPEDFAWAPDLLSRDAPTFAIIRDDFLAGLDSETVAQIENAERLVVAIVHSIDDSIEALKLPQRLRNARHVLETSSSSLKQLVEKLRTDRPDPFRMKHWHDLFRPQSLRDASTVSITKTTEFNAIYDRLEAYVTGLKCFSEFQGVARAAAYELLSNAFYNGKRDADGHPSVSDRKLEFELDAGERVDFTFGLEGDYLWLIVRDYFGTLDRSTLLRAIERASRERRPNYTTGGAGLGIMMVYDWATEMSFVLQPGKLTEVACKFRLTPRNRVFSSEPSALNILITEANEDLGGEAAGSASTVTETAS